MKKLLALGFGLLLSLSVSAATLAEDTKYYRDLTHNIRKDATFAISVAGHDEEFSYHFDLAKPIYPMPIVEQARIALDPKNFFRKFWDRIFLTPDSYMLVAGKKIPLTCIFIDGQDNRYAGPTDERIAKVMLKIYLVAKDTTCTGPLNPDYPNDGTISELWDTYLYYEVKNVETFWPKGIRLRTLWSDSYADFVR